MDGRRGLSFEGLDEVMPEVERLLAGHSTRGAWTLGQILHHLATAVRLVVEPVEGPRRPAQGPEGDRASEVRRRLFFRAGRFPEGAEIPLPALVPPGDADPRFEADRLREALGRLEASRGPFPDHPRFGPMSKGEWVAFHRIHCAHHLSFASVEPGRAGSR